MDTDQNMLVLKVLAATILQNGGLLVLSEKDLESELLHNKAIALEPQADGSLHLTLQEYEYPEEN